MPDNVNHPNHYGGKDDPYETIKVLRHKLTPQEYAGALKFQVMKYNDRHTKKNGLEDLKKAQFYQNELVRFVEEVGHDTIYPPPMMILTGELSAETRDALQSARPGQIIEPASEPSPVRIGRITRATDDETAWQDEP